MEWKDLNSFSVAVLVCGLLLAATFAVVNNLPEREIIKEGSWSDWGTGDYFYGGGVGLGESPDHLLSLEDVTAGEVTWENNTPGYKYYTVFFYAGDFAYCENVAAHNVDEVVEWADEIRAENGMDAYRINGYDAEMCDNWGAKSLFSPEFEMGVGTTDSIVWEEMPSLILNGEYIDLETIEKLKELGILVNVGGELLIKEAVGRDADPRHKRELWEVDFIWKTPPSYMRDTIRVVAGHLLDRVQWQKSILGAHTYRINRRITE